MGGNGKFLLETHFHTAESSPCGRVPAEEGIIQYKAAGYDGVIVTDHFNESVWGGKEGGGWKCDMRQAGTQQERWRQRAEQFLEGYRAAKACGGRCAVRVYLGMEIRFPGNDDDILVYGFSENFLYEHPWLYLGDVRAFRSLAEQQGLFMAQAHPFRNMCTRIRPEYLDGIEIFNGNPRHDSHNEEARLWAKEHALRETAGSDYHQRGDISGSGILLQTGPAQEREIAELLLAHKYDCYCKIK